MDQNGETLLQSHVFCPASAVQTSANCHSLRRHPKPNLSANHVSWFIKMQIPAECSLATNAHKREERKPAAWTSPKKCPENVWFVAAGKWQCQGQVCKCDSSNPAADGLQHCLEESHLFRRFTEVLQCTNSVQIGKIATSYPTRAAGVRTVKMDTTPDDLHAEAWAHGAVGLEDESLFETPED